MLHITSICRELGTIIIEATIRNGLYQDQQRLFEWAQSLVFECDMGTKHENQSLNCCWVNSTGWGLYEHIYWPKERPQLQSGLDHSFSLNLKVGWKKNSQFWP